VARLFIFTPSIFLTFPKMILGTYLWKKIFRSEAAAAAAALQFEGVHLLQGKS